MDNLEQKLEALRIKVLTNNVKAIVSNAVNRILEGTTKQYKNLLKANSESEKTIVRTLKEAEKNLSVTSKEADKGLQQQMSSQTDVLMKDFDTKADELGQSVNQMTDQFEDLKSTIKKKDFTGPQGEEGTDGKPGPTGAKGPKGDKGLRGFSGRDGLDGSPGTDGSDGTDGSPDDPEEIVAKLESLKGNKRLNAKAIRGLEKMFRSTVVSLGGSSDSGGSTGTAIVNWTVDDLDLNGYQQYNVVDQLYITGEVNITENAEINIITS